LLDKQPTIDETRKLVLAEVKNAENVVRNALASVHAAQFVWHGSRLWIDPVRCLVLDETISREDVDIARLSNRSCRRSAHSAREFVNLLAEAIVFPDRKLAPNTSAEFLTYAIAQGIVNPAFRSLFWLGLDVLLRRETSDRKLDSVLGAMAYDLSHYPESRSEAGQIRDAQINFVRDRLGLEIEGNWRHATDEAWSERCDRILEEGAFDEFWYAIRERVGGLLGEETHHLANDKRRDELSSFDKVALVDDGFRLGPFKLTLPQEWRHGRSVTAQTWMVSLSPGTQEEARLTLSYSGTPPTATSLIERWHRMMANSDAPQVTTTNQDSHTLLEVAIPGAIGGKQDQLLLGALVVYPTPSSGGGHVTYSLQLTGARSTVELHAPQFHAMTNSIGVI
jgi:hypothetical protein